MSRIDGGGRMKCFKCGLKCQTNYQYNQEKTKIISVTKKCPDYLNCDWESHPTKIPEPI